MKAFGGAGVGRPETKAERHEIRAAKAAKGSARVRALSDNQKINLLARTIASSVLERGSFQQLDGTQAGFTQTDVTRLYDQALVRAHRIEPRLLAAQVAQ